MKYIYILSFYFLIWHAQSFNKIGDNTQALNEAMQKLPRSACHVDVKPYGPNWNRFLLTWAEIIREK
jgi:hypothetical protein